MDRTSCQDTGNDGPSIDSSLGLRRASWREILGSASTSTRGSTSQMVDSFPGYFRSRTTEEECLRKASKLAQTSSTVSISDIGLDEVSHWRPSLTNPDKTSPNALEVILDNAAREARSRTVEAQDHYILDFFGSIEMVKKHGHEYVLEEHPVELEQIEMEGFGDDHIALRISQTYKLRRKTEEELKEIQE